MGLSSSQKKRTSKKGKGLKGRRQRVKTGKGSTLNSLVKKARKAIKSKKVDSVGAAVNVAMGAIKGSKHVTRIPRIIPVLKSAGALSLIPILATASALGAGASGISSIVKAIGDIRDAKKKIFPGTKKQIGNGFYLAPYKKNGLGLYLKPYPIKNSKTW